MKEAGTGPSLRSACSLTRSTGPGHRVGKTPGVGVLALQEVDPLRAYAASTATDAMHLHDQPYLPSAPRQVAHVALSDTVDTANANPAVAAREERGAPDLPDPDRERRSLLVAFPPIGSVSGQPENPAYNSFGHPPRDLLSRLASENGDPTSSGAPTFLKPTSASAATAYTFWNRPGKTSASKPVAGIEPRSYDHPEAKTLLRPDVGTQAKLPQEEASADVPL